MTEPNYQLVLEKAELELTNVRTQLVLGMLCVLGSCLFNHSDHLFNFAVSLALCLVLALITLEVTGRFGNRLKASAACWAALLFSAYPLHYAVATPVVDYDDMLITLLKGIAVFTLLRFLLLREIKYAIVTVLAAISVLALSILTLGPPHVAGLGATENMSIASFWNLQDFVFPMPFVAHTGLLKTLLLSIYIVLLCLVIVRLMLRTINWKVLFILLVCIPLVSYSASLFPFLLCLSLSLMALPVIDHAKFNFARIISYVGIACLSVLFLTWCQINRLERRYLPHSAVDLSPIQSQIRK
jgi:hypothetical protein